MWRMEGEWARGEGEGEGEEEEGGWAQVSQEEVSDSVMSNRSAVGTSLM